MSNKKKKMQAKQYRVIVVICLMLIYIIQIVAAANPQSLGFYEGSPLQNRLWFPFFHANVLHLACNCYALYFCLNNRIFNGYILTTILLSISFISSFAANTAIPTLGSSAIVFAMIGINMAICRSLKYWMLVSFSLGAGFFLPSVNGLIHLISFFLGYIAGASALLFKRLRYDYRTVNSGK